MKQDRFYPYVKAGLTVFLVVAAAILLHFLLQRYDRILDYGVHITQILRPIFMGMILAFLLLPIHRHILNFFSSRLPEHMLEKKHMGSILNILAIFISLILAAVLIYLLLAMLLPQLYLSIVGFVQSIPSYSSDIQKWLQTFLDDNPEIQSVILPYYTSIVASVEKWLQSHTLPNPGSVTEVLQWLNGILPNLTGVVASVSTMVWSLTLLLKDAFIAIIVSVYLLASKDKFAAQSKKITYSLLPVRYADLVIAETRNAYRIFSGFINGKLLDSLIIGVICFVCCSIFKFPYPVLVATIVGVTNIIPFFGPFIGAIPCSILIFLVSPIQCLYFVFFILVLQLFDGYILGPRILGNSIGLASFWVLFSILLAGGLFGFAGMVLGVPVFAVLYSILRRLVARGLKRRGLPVETEFYMGNTQPLKETVNSSDNDAEQ